jgi:hypothetical protein
MAGVVGGVDDGFGVDEVKAKLVRAWRGHLDPPLLNANVARILRPFGGGAALLKSASLKSIG